MFSQNIKGVSEVPGVINGVHRLCYHVIDVYLYGAPNLLLENLVHETLIGGDNVLQTKGHNLVAVQPTVGDKDHFILIGLVYWNLVVPRENIYETKYLISCCSINQLVYPGKLDAILGTRFFQIHEIYTNMPFPVGLLD